MSCMARPGSRTIAWTIGWFTGVMQGDGVAWMLRSILQLLIVAILVWVLPHAVLVDVILGRMAARSRLAALLYSYRVEAALSWSVVAAVWLLCPSWMDAIVGILPLYAVHLTCQLARSVMSAVSLLLALCSLALQFWAQSPWLVYYGALVGLCILSGR